MAIRPMMATPLCPLFGRSQHEDEGVERRKQLCAETLVFPSQVNRACFKILRILTKQEDERDQYEQDKQARNDGEYDDRCKSRRREDYVNRRGFVCHERLERVYCFLNLVGVGI